MKTENKTSSKIIAKLQEMDEVDIFRLIARKHTVSELSNLFLIGKTAIYEFCKKYEVEYVVGECEEQAMQRKSKPVERNDALIVFSCDICKVKKPVELESPKMGTCTKCLLNSRRNRV